MNVEGVLLLHLTLCFGIPTDVTVQEVASAVTSLIDTQLFQVDNNIDCGNMQLIRVEAVGSKEPGVRGGVVAGTHYQLALRLERRVGLVCEELLEMVCYNITVYEALPWACALDDNCVELVDSDRITCVDDTDPEERKRRKIASFFLEQQQNNVTCELSPDCIPLSECPVLKKDLERVWAEEDEGEEEVKRLICDDNYNVCCPVYMGGFQTILGGGPGEDGSVFAVNNSAVQIRIRKDEWNHSDLEAFFWKDANCFPSIEYGQEILFPDLRDLDVRREEDLDTKENVDHNLDEDKIITLRLPSTVTVQELRCLSVWNGEEELGFGQFNLFENN